MDRKGAAAGKNGWGAGTVRLDDRRKAVRQPTGERSIRAAGRFAAEALERRMLLSISPTLLPGPAANASPVAFKDKLYYTATSAGNYGLWSSGGTPASTSVAVPLAAAVTSLTPAAGHLFYTDAAGTGELWVTNGTPGATLLLHTFNPNHLLTNGGPFNLTAEGSTLFFDAANSANGVELWKSDGTASGTVMVANINPGAADSLPHGLTNVGGTLFFYANDGTHGYELWKSDGTAAGTAMVADINPGGGSAFQSVPGGVSPPLAGVNGTVFFPATADGVNYQLWESGPGGTFAVPGAAPGNSPPAAITVLSGGPTEVLFVDANVGKLFVSNGTAAGTIPVLTFPAQSTIPSQISVSGGKAYFTTSNTVSNTYTLWVSDGTVAGTNAVETLPNADANAQPLGSVTAADGDFYFSGADVAGHYQLWQSDGSAAGTQPLTAFAPQAAGLHPQRFAVVNNSLYFNADDGTHGNSLWVLPAPTSTAPPAASDLTATAISGLRVDLAWQDHSLGTAKYRVDRSLSDNFLTIDQSYTLSAGQTSLNDTLAVPNAFYYYRVIAFNNNGNSSPITTVVATPALSYPPGVVTIDPASGWFGTQILGTWRNNVIFVAFSQALGKTLVRSEGSIITPLVPVVQSVTNVSSVGNTLFFDMGSVHWKSDGTANGTVPIPGGVSQPAVAGYVPVPYEQVAFYGSTYFLALTPDQNNFALWNGNDPATAVVVKVLPASRFDPHELTAVNGTIFFEDGGALWSSDGTGAGTATLKVIGYTNEPTIKDLTVVAGRLFFTTHLGIGSDNNGTLLYDGQLWTSDGTAAGTVPVPGLPVIHSVLTGSPGQLTDVNETIFFSADLGSYKLSLYGALLHYTPPSFTPAKPSAPGDLIASSFSAGEVDVTWSDNAVNEEGYHLERSSSPTFASIGFSTTLVPNTTSYVDLGVAPGQTYYYRLTDFNDGGVAVSIISNPVTTPVGPAAPTNLVAVNAVPGREVDLTWTDQDPSATGYALQRSTNPLFYPSSTVDLTTVLQPGVSSYSDTSVARLTHYYYRVFAISAAGNSAAITTSITTPESAPNAPTGFQVVGVSATEIDLLWTNNAVNADPAHGYRIERAGVDGVFSEIMQLPATASNYSDTGLAPDGIYTYQIRAVNLVGPSSYAGPITTQALPPQLITPVTVLPTVGTVTIPSDTDASPVYTSNGVGFFVGNDPIQGRGLFRIDSPGATPTYIKKIFIDIRAANGVGMLGVGGTLYFFAFDNTGTSLWKSDGTTAGTVPVAFIYNFDGGAEHSFMAIGSTMYFTAVETNGPHLLYRSDGTAAGTYVIEDTGGTFGPGSLTAVGGLLYFTAGTGLYKTDGTVANTTFLQDIGVTSFTAVGNSFFFFTADRSLDFYLWKTDGVADPVQLAFLGQGSLPLASSIIAYNNSFYFTFNQTFYRSNGTPAGTVPVTPPSAIWTSQAKKLMTMNGKLLFITDRFVGNSISHTLWVSDGTDAGTTPILDIIRPGNQAIDIMANFNGILYFTLTANVGLELWKSDLTPGGTQFFKLLSQAPGNFATFGSDLYFDLGGQDTTMWLTDGTVAGTQAVPFLGVTYPAHPDWMATVNGRVFFVSSLLTGASTEPAIGGQELWTSDGTAAGTIRLFTGPARDTLNFNGILYFVGNNNQIWKTDGTVAGTVLVKDLQPLSPFAPIVLLGTLNSILFFAVKDAVNNGYHLWQTDAAGNAAAVLKSDGTTMTVAPQIFTNAPAVTASSGGYFYFPDGQFLGGSPFGSLWRTNGISPPAQVSGLPIFGVTAVKDVNGTLYVANNGLFSVAAATGAASLLLGPSNQLANFEVTDLTNVGGSLYFSGPMASSGFALWRSDGTVAGTVPVVDPSPDSTTSPSSGRPFNITDVNGVAFFMSVDAYNGDPGPVGAVWRTDGTTAGTFRIRDLNIQQNPLYGPRPVFMANVAGTVVYADGERLWRSDGTTANTVQVDDVNTASNGTTSPAYFGGTPYAVLGNQIFYSAAVPGGGRDLRVAWLVAPTAPSSLGAGAASLKPALKSSANLTTGVQLHWVDHSTNESGFVVDRSTSLTFQTLNKSFFVPANSTTFTDTTASLGEYYYRVRAVNAGGFSIFSNTTAPPAVVGRYVFYNNSAWDGFNPSANPNVGDSAAIATDKQALLPNHTATFANYTSYSLGLNGVMIDLLNPGNGPALVAGDFQFRIGNSNTPGSWGNAAAPSVVIDFPGKGAGGSDRIELIWPDGAIQNKWLQITMLADAHTGLAVPDVFYFGNAVGSAGDDPTSAAVVAADELLARVNGTGLSAAAINNSYDYNRDKHVNTQDQLIARSNRSALTPLALISVPAGATSISSPSGSSTTAATKSSSATSATAKGVTKTIPAPVTKATSNPSTKKTSTALPTVKSPAEPPKATTTGATVLKTAAVKTPTPIAVSKAVSASKIAAVKVLSTSSATVKKSAETTIKLAARATFSVMPIQVTVAASPESADEIKAVQPIVAILRKSQQ